MTKITQVIGQLVIKGKKGRAVFIVHIRCPTGRKLAEIESLEVLLEIGNLGLVVKGKHLVGEEKGEGRQNQKQADDEGEEFSFHRLNSC